MGLSGSFDFEDYRRVENKSEDGIISSEDQLLCLRQELGDDVYHVQMVVSIYGDQTPKSVQPVQVCLIIC